MKKETIAGGLVGILIAGGIAVGILRAERCIPGIPLTEENITGWINSKDYRGTLWDAYMAEKTSKSKSNWKAYQNFSLEDSLPDFNGDGCIGKGEYRICEEK